MADPPAAYRHHSAEVEVPVAPRVRVEALGPLRATVDGEVVELGTPKQRVVLAALVAAGGRPVSIGRLMDTVWPSDAPTRARHSIQQYASRLRGVLEPGRERGAPSSVLVAAAGGYALHADTDVAGFLADLATARGSLDSGDLTAAVAAFRRAEQQWRGPAFGDLVDVPALAIEAQRLDELRLAATEDRIGAVLRQGAPAALPAEVERLLADHPLRERLWSLLVQALHAVGRRADALAAYDRARGILADELGLDPGTDLRAAHHAVLTDQAPGPTGPPSADGATNPVQYETTVRDPTPVPRYRTSLVGRGAELATLRDLLAAGAVVTVTGVGGVGKTRLVAEVAAQVAERFRDGVSFAALAPVRDPSDVAAALLEAVGLEQQTTRAPVDVLLEGIEALEVLLVVDNAEHVVDRTAELVDRVAAASPASAVLVTSRVALGIAGEQVVPLGPLAHGQPDGTSPSLDLLLQRARLTDPSLVPDEALAELGRRLDGIPLAIEMVAPWIRTMGAAGILANLDEVLRIPGSEERRPTMAATIRWSEELLDEVDRRAFAHLGVLAGDWGLDAAAAVLDLPAGAQVISTVGRLVDRSLVEVVGDGPRYRMLEPVRQAAVARLSEAGDEAAARDRHLAHFAGVTRDVRRATNTAGQAEQYAVADRERPNLRTAHEWACRSGDGDRAAAIVGDLLWYWLVRQRADEALERGHRALSAGPDDRQLARVLIALTQAAFFRGRLEESVEHAEAAVAAAARTADDRLQGMAAVTAARTLANAKRIERAEELLAAARGHFEAAGSARGVAEVLLAEMQHLPRDLATCLALADEAQSLVAGAPGIEDYVAATADAVRATAALVDGRLDDATALATAAAAATARSGGQQTLEAGALCLLAHARIRLDDLDGAHESLLRALDVQVTMHNQYGRLGVWVAAWAWAAERGDHELVARCVGASEAAEHEVLGNQAWHLPWQREAGVEAARDALGAQRFAELADEGRRDTDPRRLRELVRHTAAAGA